MTARKIDLDKLRTLVGDLAGAKDPGLKPVLATIKRALRAVG